MNFLKSISKIVFLNAPLEKIKRRTVNFSERGIVGLKKKGLEKLFEERLTLYKRNAGIIIDLKDFNNELIVSMIIENIL